MLLSEPLASLITFVKTCLTFSQTSPVFTRPQWKIQSLPNNKTLELTKFKAFADDNSYLAKTMISLLARTLCEKEKMLVTNIFSFPTMLVTSIFSFPTVFSKGFFLKIIKSQDGVAKG